MAPEPTQRQRPAPPTPVLRAPEPRGLCTDCGVSRMAEPKACGRVCQFIRPDYPTLEARAHGRARDPERGDERFFGVTLEIWRARLRTPRPGAQWTGLTTRIAERMLETGRVQAILTMAPDPDDVWRPRPVLIEDPRDLAACRGMRMGYAPLLALLETAAAKGLTRLGVIGIPCQIYALRALERELGLERIEIVGTPCSDNTTTENFHAFLARLTPEPEAVTYLEFRADYHVELRFADGSKREIPFLQLPIADLPADFFPLTCRTCVDYVNALADITVGYMGGEGRQWLLVRNETGRALLDLLGEEVELERCGSRGARASAVKGFVANTERAAGGLPLRRMPAWLRPIVGWLMPRIGPRGLEFARARVEMKAAETVLHLRRLEPARMKHMIPEHVWRLATPYGLGPRAGERAEPRRAEPSEETDP